MNRPGNSALRRRDEASVEPLTPRDGSIRRAAASQSLRRNRPTRRRARPPVLPPRELFTCAYALGAYAQVRWRCICALLVGDSANRRDSTVSRRST